MSIIPDGDLRQLHTWFVESSKKESMGFGIINTFNFRNLITRDVIPPLRPTHQARRLDKAQKVYERDRDFPLDLIRGHLLKPLNAHVSGNNTNWCMKCRLVGREGRAPEKIAYYSICSAFNDENGRRRRRKSRRRRSRKRGSKRRKASGNSGYLKVPSRLYMDPQVSGLIDVEVVLWMLTRFEETTGADTTTRFRETRRMRQSGYRT